MFPDDVAEAASGGLILGTTVTAMLAATGKMTGLSGIFDGAFSTKSGQGWKVIFLSGFTLGGVAAALLYPAGIDQSRSPPLGILGFAVSGLLVGVGTRIGNGCTSGHGLCGLPRLSRRSLLATFSFLTSGIATASVLASWRADDAVHDANVLSKQDPSNVIRGVAVAAAVTATAVTLWKRGRKANWKAHLSSFICGAGFAGGLVVSGMVKRSKVIDFLTIRPDTWDPSLMFVLGCGVMSALIGFPLVTRSLRVPMCRKPDAEDGADEDAGLGAKFEIPMSTELDLPLFLGALTFGVGWGAGGLCPGPAVVAGVVGFPGPAYIFLPSMLAGMKLAPPLKNALSLPDPSWVMGSQRLDKKD